MLEVRRRKTRIHAHAGRSEELGNDGEMTSRGFDNDAPPRFIQAGRRRAAQDSDGEEEDAQERALERV